MTGCWLPPIDQSVFSVLEKEERCAYARFLSVPPLHAVCFEWFQSDLRAGQLCPASMYLHKRTHFLLSRRSCWLCIDCNASDDE